MLCTILIVFGMSAGCVEMPPQRGRSADILVEQGRQRQSEFEEMKAKRNNLYRGMRECPECGKTNTLPFRQE